jgi:dTDP-4-dehydrorhamnose reductase
MRLLITGLSGTVGPHLARAARDAGAAVLGWQRQRVPPEDAPAVAAELDRLAPQAIAHLGFGPESFAAQLAGWTGLRGVPMLFTSTAMVFHHAPDGPHGADDPRNAEDDYGRYKLRCEDAVRNASAQAGIVRLGWQIQLPHLPANEAAAAPEAPAGGSNHMLAALDGWLAREGRIAASAAWRPACSCVDDTAAALWAWFEAELREPGERARLWQIDANAEAGHPFAEIARALGRAAGRTHWPVHEHTDYVHDQRLRGGGEWIPPLAARLPALLGQASLRDDKASAMAGVGSSGGPPAA